MFKARLKKLVANFVVGVTEEAVDAALDYAVEVVKNRAARAEPVTPLEPCAVKLVHMVSRANCQRCGGPLVYKPTSDQLVAYLYECTPCNVGWVLTKQQAANREGFPL